MGNSRPGAKVIVAWTVMVLYDTVTRVGEPRRTRFSRELELGRLPHANG